MVLLETVILLGIIAFAGFAFIALKKPALTMRAMAWPLVIDIVIAVVTYLLHAGSFLGVMAATVAGLAAALFTTGWRWGLGWTRPSAKLHIAFQIKDKEGKVLSEVNRKIVVPAYYRRGHWDFIGWADAQDLHTTVTNVVRAEHAHEKFKNRQQAQTFFINVVQALRALPVEK